MSSRACKRKKEKSREKSNSKLSGAKGDAVIIGASSITQCQENLLASRKGPLSEKLVNAFDEGYELVKSVQPPYFRGHFLL